jgi:hypothetical protein
MTTRPEITAEQARRLIAAAAGHNINPVTGRRLNAAAGYELGSSPQLVGLMRDPEEVSGAGVNAFHSRLLGVAGDRTR